MEVVRHYRWRFARSSCLLYTLTFTLLVSFVCCRRHKLNLEDDVRKSIPLSTFGFLKDGMLMVKVSDFSYKNLTEEKLELGRQKNNFIFSLEKSTSDGSSSYMQSSDKCALHRRSSPLTPDALSLLFFTFDLVSEKIVITRIAREFLTIRITNDTIPDTALSLDDHMQSYLALLFPKKGKKKINSTLHYTTEIPLKKRTVKGQNFYSGVFSIAVRNEPEEGLYNLYFQNCWNFANKKAVSVQMNLRIIEVNAHTFLSAGEQFLPVIYGLMSLLFFATACVYVSFLKGHRDWTFKIHYLMASLVFLKSIALVFHAANFYYIGQDGSPVESWAVLYYVTHLLKGALLFTTIVLIGTGFFFVKHVLSKKEKHMFMIIIPLQIVSNVAQIMIESTEEGTAQFATWRQIFILLDLICCGAILFPIVWSIRHLQDAAKTDGKAAISLAKLQLFRHFYVMIVCYIYFTRIIVYLIRITVPFKYMWLDEFFTEMATYLFFVITGYNFRPAPTNPYLHVPEEDEDDDIEMNEIATESGMTEGLIRKGNRKQVEA